MFLPNTKRSTQPWLVVRSAATQVLLGRTEVSTRPAPNTSPSAPEEFLISGQSHRQQRSWV